MAALLWKEGSSRDSLPAPEHQQNTLCSSCSNTSTSVVLLFKLLLLTYHSFKSGYSGLIPPPVRFTSSPYSVLSEWNQRSRSIRYHLDPLFHRLTPERESRVLPFMRGIPVMSLNIFRRWCLIGSLVIIIILLSMSVWLMIWQPESAPNKCPSAVQPLVLLINGIHVYKCPSKTNESYADHLVKEELWWRVISVYRTRSCW